MIGFVFAFAVGVVVGVFGAIYWGKINSVSDLKDIAEKAQDKIDEVKEDIKK